MNTLKTLNLFFFLLGLEVQCDTPDEWERKFLLPCRVA